MISAALALVAAGAVYSNVDAQNTKQGKVNVGLIYPISTNGTGAAADSNVFSLNAIAGLSRAESGATIAGFANVVKENARGAQIAGFSNHIGKQAEGVTLAGFLNTYGSSKGLSAAGFANIAGTTSDIQLAGFINAGGNVSAFQAAGFTNIAKKVNGSQVAGFLNQAADVKGLQLAGFMNHAKNVRGLQVSGFINVADTAQAQLGLINISKNGEMSIAATIDEVQTALLTFRSGGNITYGILGVGYNFKNKKQVYAYEAGLGVHAINTAVFRLNAELTGGGLFDFKNHEYYKTSFALMPSVRLGHIAEIFGGPSVNYVNSDPGEGPAMHRKYISSWGGHDGKQFQGFYVGYTAGVAFRVK